MPRKRPHGPTFDTILPPSFARAAAPGNSQRDSLEFGRESFGVYYSNRQNFMSAFRFFEPFVTALVCGFISNTNLSSVEVHVSGRTARD